MLSLRSYEPTTGASGTTARLAAATTVGGGCDDLISLIFAFDGNAS
jgi:hypothetical protein